MRKLRYAGNIRGEGAGEKREGGLRPEDNPLSPEFVPLEERGEMGRARFWALRAKAGDPRPAVAETNG